MTHMFVLLVRGMVPCTRWTHPGKKAAKKHFCPNETTGPDLIAWEILWKYGFADDHGPTEFPASEDSMPPQDL